MVKQLNANVTGVAFSPDGKLLAAAAANSIWIWDLSGGGMEPRKPLNAHSAPVTSLVFLPGLSPLSLVSGSEDKNLKIWEIP
jgi:WD40 repeat protein